SISTGTCSDSSLRGDPYACQPVEYGLFSSCHRSTPSGVKTSVPVTGLIRFGSACAIRHSSDSIVGVKFVSEVDNVYRMCNDFPVKSVPSGISVPPSVTGVHVVPSRLVSTVTLVPDVVVGVQSLTEPANVPMMETSTGGRAYV